MGPGGTIPRHGPAGQGILRPVTTSKNPLPGPDRSTTPARTDPRSRHHRPRRGGWWPLASPRGGCSSPRTRVASNRHGTSRPPRRTCPAGGSRAPASTTSTARPCPSWARRPRTRPRARPSSTPPSPASGQAPRTGSPARGRPPRMRASRWTIVTTWANRPTARSTTAARPSCRCARGRSSSTLPRPAMRRPPRSTSWPRRSTRRSVVTAAPSLHRSRPQRRPDRGIRWPG